jgi:hypothetical protein
MRKPRSGDADEREVNRGGRSVRIVAMGIALPEWRLASAYRNPLQAIFPLIRFPGISRQKPGDSMNNKPIGNTVSLTMESASKWVVTGTSHLTSLNDADSTYSSITCKTSGCLIYVGVKEIK